MEAYTKVEPAATGHELALMGDYFMADRNLDKAEEALKNALLKDPYTFLAHFNLAKLFEKQKQTDDAIEQYEYLMHYHFDRDAEIYLNLVNLYKERGGHERRIREILKKGHRLFPTDLAIYRLYRQFVGSD